MRAEFRAMPAVGRPLLAAAAAAAAGVVGWAVGLGRGQALQPVGWGLLGLVQLEPVR